MKKNEMLDDVLDTDEEKVSNGLELTEPVTSSLAGLRTVHPTDIESLDEMDESPIDLISSYWTPEVEGEYKRLIFDRIGITKVLSKSDNKIIDLECAFFFVNEDGVTKQIVNGSKRLVGALSSIPQYTPLQITYLGKKKNTNNSYSSDSWKINPLIPKS